MRGNGRSSNRTAVAIALILISGSIAMSACTEAGSSSSSNLPTELAEIDLTGLDVEMHYAVG